MRLIAERYSGQLTLSISKCSPSGTMRRGERVLKLKILHCTYEVHMRKKEKMTIGPHPSECWRLLKKFIMKMMMASKGIIYSFYTV